MAGLNGRIQAVCNGIGYTVTTEREDSPKTAK